VEISLKVRGNILLGASLLAVGLLLACRSTAAPLRMTLKIAPDHPTMTKPMTFTLHLTDDHGQPVNDATVNGALTMKLMDMGTTKLAFSPKGHGDYEASVKGTDMSGPWNLAIDVAQGTKQAKKNFDVTISD
jgi:nitrogen fixation protein FixH